MTFNFFFTPIHKSLFNHDLQKNCKYFLILQKKVHFEHFNSTKKGNNKSYILTDRPT